MKRILLIDDEKSIVFALRQFFVAHGCAVDCALTSEEAKDLLACGSYAVAIIDLELRGSRDSADGLVLAETIRRQHPATAVIMLTAVETPESQARATEVGVHSFLQKPTRLSRIADIAFNLIGETAAAY